MWCKFVNLHELISNGNVKPLWSCHTSHAQHTRVMSVVNGKWLISLTLRSSAIRKFCVNFFSHTTSNNPNSEAKWKCGKYLNRFILLFISILCIFNIWIPIKLDVTAWKKEKKSVQCESKKKRRRTNNETLSAQRANIQYVYE